MEGLGLTKRESYSSTLYAIEEFCALGTGDKQEDGTGCMLEKNTAVMVLCDGIGGLERGELASNAAVNAVLQKASEVDWKENPAKYLPLFLKVANEAVFELCDEDGIPLQAGTTIVLVLTVGRRLYVANVGDSRAYLIKKDSVVKLTKDHNYGEQLAQELADGSITQREYDEEMHRGAALTSYLGIGDLELYHIAEEPVVFDRDEIILIESDGLYKLVDDEQVVQIIRSNVRCLDEVGEQLLKTAEENVVNYQDNTSIILMRIK